MIWCTNISAERSDFLVVDFAVKKTKKAEYFYLHICFNTLSNTCDAALRLQLGLLIKQTQSGIVFQYYFNSNLVLVSWARARHDLKKADLAYMILQLFVRLGQEM